MSLQVRLVKDGMSGQLQEKTVSPAIPRTAWCLKDARLRLGIIQIACPNNQEGQSDIAHQHVGWPRYIEFTSVPSVRQGCFTNINLTQVSAEHKTFLSSKREIFQESQLSSCDCTILHHAARCQCFLVGFMCVSLPETEVALVPSQKPFDVQTLSEACADICYSKTHLHFQSKESLKHSPEDTGRR